MARENVIEIKEPTVPPDAPIKEDDVRNIISQSLSNMTEVLRVRNKIIVGSSNRVILDGDLGQVQFFNGKSQYGYIVTDTSLNMLYVAKDHHYYFDQTNHYLGSFFYTSASIYGVEINGGGRIQFTNGSVLTDTGATLDLDRTLTINGDCALDAGKKFQVGTTGGVSFSSGNVGGLFEMNAVGGIITYWHKF